MEMTAPRKEMQGDRMLKDVAVSKRPSIARARWFHHQQVSSSEQECQVETGCSDPRHAPLLLRSLSLIFFFNLL